MSTAHIQKFLESVQVAQQTNNQRIILSLQQAQNLAYDIGQILSIAVDTLEQQQNIQVSVLGGSFTDK
jgi:hypothetical protein